MTPLSPESLEQIRAIVQETITAAFRGQEPRFAGIDRRFEAIDQRFDAMDQRFDAMDERFTGLRQEMHDGIAENRRHFGVLNENLTAKIQLLAEGLTGTNQRVDRLERDMHDRFSQVDRRLIAISAHMPRATTGSTRARSRRRRTR